MAYPSSIGHVIADDDKKHKDGSIKELNIPFTNPSYHVLLGGGDSRHAELFSPLVQNAIASGNVVVAFDTAGMIVPFILPFLPGDHGKKARGIKERIDPGLVDAINPVGLFFNSTVEESTGSAFKGWFSLAKILLDAGKLDAARDDNMRTIFGISKKVLMKDVLKSVMVVALGKDYVKVKTKASDFVDYLTAAFEVMATRGLPYPTWKHARDALLGGTLGLTLPGSLDQGDIDVYGRTLDYYVSNAMIFKPPAPGTAALDPARLDHVNFYLFYLQDMNEREQALAFTLIFAQHAIATASNIPNPSDILSVAMKHGCIALAIDELSMLLPANNPVLDPAASTIAMLREATMHGCSFMVATRTPSQVDIPLLDSDVLEPARSRDIVPRLYIGKMREKEGLGKIISWLETKGVHAIAATMESLKASHALLVPLHSGGEITRFEIKEQALASFTATPALLKSMLAAPILVSKKPAAGAIAAPVVTGSLVQEPARTRPGAVTTHIIKATEVDNPQFSPITVVTKDPTQSPVPDPFPAYVPKPVPVIATPPVIASASHDHSFAAAKSLPPVVIDTTTPVFYQGKEKITAPVPAIDVPASSKAAARPSGLPAGQPFPAPVVEDFLDRYEPDGNDVDGTDDGRAESSHGNFGVDIDFLSRLLGAEQSTTDAANASQKISRLDYNMALNALLFKIEKVVKAPFGVNFYKELLRTRSMPIDRATEMYYQEANAMMRGKFAIQQGTKLVYQGVKEAMRAIISELALPIPVPSDADLEQLETELVKALDLPRNELLQRIKDGSLYF